MTSLYAATSGAAFLGGFPHLCSTHSTPSPARPLQPSTTSSRVLPWLRSLGLVVRGERTVNLTDGFRPLVLMRNDGVTVVGTSVPETVFRFRASGQECEGSVSRQLDGVR